MKNVISAGSSIVASEGQVSSDLGGEVAILGLGAGTYYGLDEVGGRVWTLIQEPREVAEIREALLREYEVEPERCERDLISLLQQMADEGLVEVTDAASA